jgi:1,4-dihydroxy-2-naphthoate octaprenyltransferase
MGVFMIPAGNQLTLASAHPLRRILLVLRLVRYRFFLFAGLLPYLLGAAWSVGVGGYFDGGAFWMGLAGVTCAVVGVEAFNEYFDARMGTDRVFNPEYLAPVTDGVLWLGVAAFGVALTVGIFLSVRDGWPVIVFTLIGGAAAVFYEAPPIRWVYRGFGEAAIAISYGPAMVLGSLFVQTRAVTWGAFWASLVPGFLIMALAVVNAIPDFHQDRLVGKRNLVVRLGRQRGVRLYLGLAAAGLLTTAGGVLMGVFPRACLLGMLALPFLVLSARQAMTTFQSARLFRPAIRSILGCYIVGVSLFTLGVLLKGWG